ncbi:MAG: wax ester/triacylglycerol synthase domain-containing protein [Actinomycetota bacterium]
MATADNSQRLDAADALLWAVERDPTLANNVASLSVFDAEIEVGDLRHRLERATRVVPRMRQRIVGNPASLSPPRWELDPDFDLDNHVRVIECSGEPDDVLPLISPFFDAPFDREHPLFEVVVVQGMAGGRSALAVKAHHAIADGQGMLQIQAELFAFEPDTPPPELPVAPIAEPFSSSERLTNAVEFERNRALQAVRELGTALLSRRDDRGGDVVDHAVDTIAAAIRSIAPARPLSPILTERSAETFHAIIDISLPDLRAAGRRAGTRLNSAFVAAVARGMGAFHERHGAPCSLLRMGMPISIRTEADTDGAGNHLAPVRFEVPLTADQPDHLIEIVQALTDSHRDDPAQAVIRPAQELLGRLPTQLSGPIFGQVLRGSDFLTSNVPGSPVPVWIGSAKLLAQYPFGPTSAAAVNVTLLSYQDLAAVGVSIDRAATVDPEGLVECLREGFEWVVAAPD